MIVGERTLSGGIRAGFYFVRNNSRNKDIQLRNYEVNLATLDEVNSADDSTYRAEKLAPAQFYFATSLGGIEFRPEMLTASYNNITGQLDYRVNANPRSAGRYVGQVDAEGNPVTVTYSDGSVEQMQVTSQLLDQCVYHGPSFIANNNQKLLRAGGGRRRPEVNSAAAPAAANDNEQLGAWRGAAFCFAGRELVA
jgi:hypothetical protein